MGEGEAGVVVDGDMQSLEAKVSMTRAAAPAMPREPATSSTVMITKPIETS